MDQGLKTQAAEKLFKGSKVTINPQLHGDERYIYELINEGKPYILKGYKIFIESLESGNEESKIRFMQSMKTIADVHQEYFFAKTACLFNIHFAKPLILDYDLELAKDETSLSYLFMEIIFEHSGKSLGELKIVEVGEIYNLMRQSANAFSLLHEIGITHFDIKPSNMVYNEKDEVLKVIDMGSSFGAKTIGYIYNPTITLDGKLRSYTPQFAPPEILKLAEGTSNNSNFILGAADVYSWAMCFYMMILRKTLSDLTVEADKYKKTSESTYSKFITLMEVGFKKVQVNQDEDKKKLKIISDELLDALNFKPEKRPTMMDLVERMKDFEKTEGIVIGYAKVEQQRMKRIKKMLRIEEDKKLDVNMDFVKSSEVSNRRCRDCVAGRNIKVELECGHKMCTSCILKFIMGKFANKESYNYKVICGLCEENVNLTAIIPGINCKSYKWTNFGKIITNKISADTRIQYGEYDNKPVLSSIDSYLVNDYDWFNAEYLMMCDYLESNIHFIESKTNINLIELKLNNNQIGDASAIAISNSLQKNTNITILILHDNQITDIGAIAIGNALYNNTKLIKLLLNNNFIGDTGVIAISNALETNKNITTLWLHNNLIGDEGAIAISNALQVNKIITMLTLNNNKIKNAGAIAIGNALQNNTAINELRLHNNQIGDAGAISIGNALQVNKSITILTLHINQIKDYGVIDISNGLETNISLTELLLDSNLIKDAGAIAIGNALQKNTKLTKLLLNNNLIGDAGVIAISNALEKNKTINTLTLNDNQIKNDGAIAISNVLQSNTNLTKLWLHNNEIQDIGIIAIGDSLHNNTKLTILSLHNNLIGEKGAITIVKALEENKSIIELWLNNSQIGENAAISISNALKVNTSLITLWLHNNLIGDAGAISISYALHINKSLIALSLHNNRIGIVGAIAICDALQVNKSIATLSLHNNTIKDTGAVAIGNVLEKNKSLKTLWLSNNQIGDEGVIAIIKALKKNSSLKTLWIKNNKISDKMYKVIEGINQKNPGIDIHI